MTAKTISSSNAPRKSALTPVVWVLALLGFLFFFRLGERPLRNPDEGRYAEIAREMVSSGDWQRPTVFGLGYFRKPPLFYWLTAASFQVFGENEFSARAVPALFGLLGVALVYWFGRRFFEERTALYAALILGTNLWYVQVARYLVIDAVYSFFLTGAVFFFYAAMRSEGRKNIFPFLFFGSLGGAFLAKGPSALVIAGLPALIHLIRSRRWEVFRGASWWAGAGLFFLIALPWFVALSRREPGFFDFFFLHEHVQRFTSADFEHQEPWYYYLAVLPALFLPWSLYWRKWEPDDKKHARRFLWSVILVTVVFFSLSRTKLPTYVLPCLPLLSLLAADSWKRWMASGPVARFADFFPVALICFASLVLIVGTPVFFRTHPDKYPAALASDLQLLGAAGLAGSVVSLRLFARGRKQLFFFALLATLAAFSFCVQRVMETMNPVYSNKVFAEKARPYLNGKEEIFIYDHPGPFYDFEFYLKRPVRLVGLEGELAHSRRDPKAGEISVTREDFFSLLREKKPLVVLMRRSDYLEMDGSLRAGLRILDQDRRKVLLRSGPEPAR